MTMLLLATVLGACSERQTNADALANAEFIPLNINDPDLNELDEVCEEGQCASNAPSS